MQKPTILVSACLLGEPVRHDGRDNLINSPFVNALRTSKRLVSICPEVAGGLSAPRPLARIKQRFPLQIITTDSQDVTEEFLAGADAALDLARQRGCVAALMKAGSPSCGNSAVMGGSWSGKQTEGAGVVAQELIHKGIPVFNEHQLDALEAFLAHTEAQIETQIEGQREALKSKSLKELKEEVSA